MIKKNLLEKMTKRFAQLNGVLSHLRQTSLVQALPGDLAESTGLETIGAMVGSEFFKFAGQF